MAAMQIHTVKYYNPSLAIGLEDIRNAWLFILDKEPVKLKTIIHQGNLSYRLPVSGKRVSYKKLKQGLIKKQILIKKKEQQAPF
jgi:hypothetical protein